MRRDGDRMVARRASGPTRRIGWTGALAVAAAVLGLTLLGACGDDAGGTTKADPTEREAQAWVKVLTTVGMAGTPVPSEGEPLPVLFALEADGGLVPAGVQVAVVKAMKDTADVRFLDEREGAIAHDQPGEPVKDDGTLVVVSEIPPAGGQVEVDVERYRAAGDRTEFVVVLTGGNPTWAVASVDPPL